MKPPPGSLWPRSSTKTENSSIRLVEHRRDGAEDQRAHRQASSARILRHGRAAALMRISARMASPAIMTTAISPSVSEAAEIDDDDVDDVAAMRDRLANAR